MDISIGEFLDKVEIEIMNKKIQEFNSMDFRDISSRKIQEKLFEIICVEDTNSGLFSVFPYYFIEVPKGERLFRVRKFDAFKELYNKNLTPNDLWNNPKSPIGRMNLEGEPVLYLCMNSPETACHEAKVENNETFTLIVFTVIEDISLTAVYAQNRYDGNLNDLQQEKADILNNFLYEKLCMDIAADNSYFYKITNSIKYIFANYEKTECDGCLYPSAITRSSVNLCLKYPNFKSKLKIDGFIRGEKTDKAFHFSLGATPYENNEISVSVVSEDFMKILGL